MSCSDKYAPNAPIIPARKHAPRRTTIFCQTVSSSLAGDISPIEKVVIRKYQQLFP